MTNTSAYWGAELVEAVKSFIGLASELYVFSFYSICLIAIHYICQQVLGNSFIKVVGKKSVTMNDDSEEEI